MIFYRQFAIVFFAWITFCGLSEVLGTDLYFAGTPKPGEKYIFTVSTKQSTTLSLTYPGTDRLLTRKDSYDITLSGLLRYSKESVLKAQFEIRSISVTINAVKQPDFLNLRKRTVIIDFTKDTDNFLIVPELDEKNLFPEPEKPSYAVNDILSRVFNGNSLSGISAFLGESKKNVKRGERWNIDTSPIVNQLKERDITVRENQISGHAEYHGRVKIMEQENDNIAFAVETRKLPGYDFKTDILISIPLSGSRVPSRIQRMATEVVNRLLPSDLPALAGGMLESYSTDESTITILDASIFESTSKN